MTQYLQRDLVEKWIEGEFNREGKGGSSIDKSHDYGYDSALQSLIDAIHSGTFSPAVGDGLLPVWHEVSYSYSHGTDVVRLLSCPFCGSIPFVGEIPPHKHLIANMPEHLGSWTIECGCGAGLIDETLEAVTARWNTRSHDGWIACSERLPEQGHTVLVQHVDDLYPISAYWLPEEGVATGGLVKYSTICWHYEGDGPEDTMDCKHKHQPLFRNPTHWQPLPAQPLKEGTKSGCHMPGCEIECQGGPDFDEDPTAGD